LQYNPPLAGLYSNFEKPDQPAPQSRPSDQLAIAIKRSLAGDEDHAADLHVNDLRIAWRSAKLGRIEAPDGPCLAIGHEASSLPGAVTERTMISL
jgi:hypothetical protein